MVLRTNSPLLNDSGWGAVRRPTNCRVGSAHQVTSDEAGAALGSKLAPHAEASGDRVFPLRCAAVGDLEGRSHLKDPLNKVRATVACPRRYSRCAA